MPNNIDSKIINNAIIAYFFLGGLLLLNKDNKYINNSFVRNHAKTAFFLHALFLFIFFVFSFLGVLGQISVFSYNLHYILTTILYLGVFSGMAYGSYKAYNGEELSIGEIIKFTKTENIVNISQNSVNNEKDKLSLILSYIPFISIIIHGKFPQSKTIENTSKLSLYLTLIVVILYVTGYKNISNLFLLFYTIFIVFSGLVLLLNNKIIVIDLSKLWSFESFYIHIKTSIKYINAYFFGKGNFKKYSVFFTETREKMQTRSKKIYLELKNKKSIPFNSLFLYIPIVNFISLIFLKTKYKIHIINGISISVVLLLIWVKFGFNNNVSLLLLFPIFHGIANRHKLYYRFPILYDVYNLILKIIKKITSIFSFLVKKRKDNKEVVLTVKDFKVQESKATISNNPKQSKI